MIIVELKGGLGNQLFQCAVGRYLSYMHNTELFLDLSFLQSHQTSSGYFTPRNYELHIFPNLYAKIIDPIHIKKYYIKPNNLKEKIIGKIRRTLDGLNVIYEANELNSSNMLKYGHNCYLIGYWQNEKYFKPIENLLRNELTPQIALSPEQQELLNRVQNTESVAVHIRRGDYLKLTNHYTLLDWDYYWKAIQTLTEIVKNPFFYFFTEDTQWIKDMLFNFKYEHMIMPVQTTGIDFMLMSNCKHQIIANSTFSWWAAYLNSNANQKVVAPKKWYVSKEENPSLTQWILI
ncbi:MAG: alpha-1,2-fucosyltransferase [Bacteroidales bacterium]